MAGKVSHFFSVTAPVATKRQPTLESLSADGDVSTSETARLHSGFAVPYPSAVSQYGKFAVFHPSDFLKSCKRALFAKLGARNIAEALYHAANYRLL